MTNLAITHTTYIQLVPTTGTRVSVQIPDGYPKVQALTDNGPLNSRLFHCHTTHYKNKAMLPVLC